MNTVTLTIDGKQIKTDSRNTVLAASLENGIHIPTLCYHKKLHPIGSCRICLVEVEGSDIPMASCQLPVQEGMTVTTQSEKLTRQRRMMVQLILQNHPLDCPVCERSGEYSLQNLTYELNVTKPDFKAEPVTRQKRKDWGLIRYNPYLCVLCERCVRICHEVQGVSALRFSSKGYKSVIDTVDGKPLDCEFCGQCLSVCPVGALSSSLVLPARSWELKKINTTCPFCGTGCSLNLEVKKDRVCRVSSSDSIGMNNGNLCKKGHFDYPIIYSEERIQTPLIKKGEKLVKASWDEAITLIAGRFQEIIKNSGREAIAGIGSERAPNEDNFLFYKFFNTAVGSPNVDFLLNMEAPAFGKKLTDGFKKQVINSTDRIAESDLIFTFGVDPSKENPVIGNIIRKAVQDNGTSLIIGASRDVGFKPEPDQKLLYRPGSEMTLLSGIMNTIRNTSHKKAEAGRDKNQGDYSSACGIEQREIEKSAFTLSRSKSPVILVGLEIIRHPDGEAVLNTLNDLATLIGGHTLLYREHCNTQGLIDMAWGSPECPNILDIALKGNIKALYIMGEDLLTRPIGRDTQKALGKIDFLVVQDMLLTQTAKAAHVVLPSSSFAEREGTYTNMEGRVQKINKAIPRIGESRPDWEIINELGRKMGWKFNYTSAEEIFNELSEKIPYYKRLTYRGLEDKGALLDYPSD